MIIFLFTLISVLSDKLEKRRWLLWLAVIAIPLPYIAGQLGWLLAEMGRQPWVIQDLMPTLSAVTKNSAGNVQITFWLFVVTFTVLLIAELKIMLTVIKKGPKEGGH